MMRKPASVATAIWLLLLGLTALSLSIGERTLLGRFSSIAIVAIAFVKGRFVILYYMEATRAPTRWRILYETWNVAAAGLIVAGYVLS